MAAHTFSYPSSALPTHHDFLWVHPRPESRKIALSRANRARHPTPSVAPARASHRTHAQTEHGEDGKPRTEKRGKRASSPTKDYTPGAPDVEALAAYFGATSLSGPSPKRQARVNEADKPHHVRFSSPTKPAPIANESRTEGSTHGSALGPKTRTSGTSPIRRALAHIFPSGASYDSHAAYENGQKLAKEVRKMTRESEKEVKRQRKEEAKRVRKEEEKKTKARRKAEERARMAECVGPCMWLQEA